MKRLERGVVELPTFAGVVAYVTPLSPVTRQVILDQAKVVHPDFDTEPFMVEVPNSAVPDQKFLDDQNPEYRRLMFDLMAQRNTYITRLHIEMAVEFRESEDELVARYKPQLTKLKMLYQTDTDWQIVLHQIILNRQSERQLVLDIATDKAPLTEGEVQDGLRIFRLQLPGYGLPAAEAESRGV